MTLRDSESFVTVCMWFTLVTLTVFYTVILTCSILYLAETLLAEYRQRQSRQKVDSEQKERDLFHLSICECSNCVKRRLEGDPTADSEWVKVEK